MEANPKFKEKNAEITSKSILKNWHVTGKLNIFGHGKYQIKLNPS